MARSLTPNNNTIAALATPPGVGGIAVVRISGAQAKEVAAKLVPLKRFQKNKAVFTHLFGFKSQQMLDQVVVTYFQAPHSFTGEDVVEISCHGSIYISQRVVEECLKAGARLAEPGEFTKRAFINGKIDLTQVEAVSEMIAAKSDVSAQLALKHLEGDVSKAIKALRKECVELLSEIEASLDFPEEIAEPKQKVLQKKIKGFQRTIEVLLKNSNAGLIAQKGISVVLAGRTNVGKSSLFNYLAKESRAIVTEVHGTTRDYLEAQVSINGVAVTLIDTAGIRNSKDKVENLGIARSKEYINAADLVLFVLDAQDGCSPEDKLIENTLPEKKIIVLNKADLNSTAQYKNGLLVSTKTGKGIAQLEQKILKMMDVWQLDLNKQVYVSSLRQKEKLLTALEAIQKAASVVAQGEIIDLLAVEVKSIIFSLGEITGDNVSEEVISQIFENFCVGK